MIRLSEAIEDHGLTLVSHEVGLILDEFDNINVPGVDYRRFRTLRTAVVKIVQHARMSPPPQLAAGSEERKTEVHSS